MGQPDPPQREKGQKVRIAAPRPPVRRAPRTFQLAVATGRKSKRPAWVPRGEVKDKY